MGITNLASFDDELREKIMSEGGWTTMTNLLGSDNFQVSLFGFFFAPFYDVPFLVAISFTALRTFISPHDTAISRATIIFRFNAPPSSACATS
jgi:hypothetical protein